MTFLETFAVLLVIWGLLAVIVLGAFYLTGYVEMFWHRWQGRRQAAREYRQFSARLEAQCDQNRARWAGYARFPEAVDTVVLMKPRTK